MLRRPAWSLPQDGGWKRGILELELLGLKSQLSLCDLEHLTQTRSFGFPFARRNATEGTHRLVNRA